MKQLQMIQKTKSLAETDKRISSIFMYGSFTKNEGDQYSDIEFYIFLKDKTNFSATRWVSQIHPLVLFFTNEYGSEVAIFENFIRGEFHFLETEEMNVIKSWDGLVTFSDFEKMILVDKDGLLSDTLAKIENKDPERATSESINWLSKSLINVLLTTSNLIKREEFAHAYQSLHTAQKYLLWLIRIETKNTEHWESPTKNLESDIDHSWYSDFQQVTCELDENKIKNAFEKSLELSKRLLKNLNAEPKTRKLLARIG